MWANGLQYSVVVAAARRDPQKYGGLLTDFSSGLEEGYWDPSAPVPGFNAYCSGPDGTDKYYDDNAWMAISFAEAYKNTCVNAPAAATALHLALLSQDRKQLAWALRIRTEPTRRKA